MTVPTPETLVRHELAGLQVEVVDAPNPDLVGVGGRVVRETTNTLVVGADSAASREPVRKQVPKEGTTLEFALPSGREPGADRTDEAAATREGAGTASKRSSETAGSGASDALAGGSGACEGVAYVTVDGGRLLSRPARRTETGGQSKWR